MSFFSYSKNFQGVAEVFLRDPERYAPVLQFLEKVMVGESQLTKIQREILAGVVSTVNGCWFCVGAHKATLEALGAERGILEALDGPVDALPVDERFRVLLRYAVKLTRTPNDMEKEDVTAVLAAGWSEQAIEDAINVAALFNYVNRLVDAFGIEGNERYFRSVGTALARNGYAPLLQRAVKRAS